MAFFSAKRHAQTTIPCSACRTPLTAHRGCREVTLRCDACQRSFPLAEYIPQMDDALEQFLDQSFVDRL